MESEKGEICLGEASDGETHDHDSGEDDEEFCYASVPVSKLQPRKVLSKGRWINEMGMAEVEVLKGPIWSTTGIVRGGKIYCSIEEVLFLAELGAFLLMDDAGTHLSMEDMYAKISDENNGCSWEYFQAYRQLKSLGYIVARHDIPWSLKTVNSNSGSSIPICSLEKVADLKSDDTTSITAMFSRVQIDEVKPIFDVYPPNSKFRKSSPGDPIFVLCFSSGSPPSKMTFEVLESHCRGVPPKFCHVEQGRVDDWLERVIEEKGEDLYRMKGVLSVEGSDQRYVFQGVHSMLDGCPGSTWGPDEKRVNKLVFIGRNLDANALRKGFKGCLL